MPGIEEYVTLEPTVVRLGIAAALGLLVGLEREWAAKAAGIRTFALVSLVAAVFTVLDRPLLLAAGGGLLVVHAGLLGGRGLLAMTGVIEDDAAGLSLTTSVSLFVAYGVGILVATGEVLAGVAVAVLASLLLARRQELHGFAQGLSRAEVTSAVEFAVLAFVIYPLLPREGIGPWNAIEPRTVWLLVVAVSGVGFVNYVIVKRYGGRGLAVTGFFGGLVNSTAVIGELASRVRAEDTLRTIVPGAILLADAAMALRNLLIAGAFMPEAVGMVAPPLLAVIAAGVGAAVLVGDWSVTVDPEFESPFRLRTALRFGALFLGVLIVAAGARQVFGAAGVVGTSFLAGLVSSGSATTTAVSLFVAGNIGAETAATAVLAGTVASILVKVGLAASMDRSLLRPVSVTTTGMIGSGVLAAVATLAML